MENKININLIILFFAVVLILFLFFNKTTDEKDDLVKADNRVIEEWKQESKKEQKLIKSWLKTDTSKIIIDFDDILWWWPSKDGIPSINNPKFLSIEKAMGEMNYLEDESLWISVEINSQAKFYPYEILVWHEIVNDELVDKKIAITFCPLCWSAVVYDRNVNSEELIFWVSWKLYQSNLLMYDNKTESLWSQSLWEALVWEKLWTKLEVIKSNLMTFSEFKENYNDWLVLSDDTWFSRSYWNIPYKGYDDSETLYFPVENEDSRYHKKEIFYIVNDEDRSLAFLLKDLKELEAWELKLWDKVYKATYNNWIVNVELDSKIISWYYEMWFSWVNHNTWNKNVWSK